MKINWKQVAKSPGYQSLKAAYIESAMQAGRQKHPMRDKEKLYKNFQWVICRAKHYAEHLNWTIESVLVEWEAKRTYGMLNYYQNCCQPRFHSDSKKPIGLKGILKSYKNDRFYKDNNSIRSRRMLEAIMINQKKRDSGKKPRWSPARKKRGY